MLESDSHLFNEPLVVNSVNPIKQENPPAWTQEAYRPPRSKYTLCCSGGRGTPPPVSWMGYPPLRCEQSENITSRHRSDAGGNNSISNYVNVSKYVTNRIQLLCGIVVRQMCPLLNTIINKLCDGHSLIRATQQDIISEINKTTSVKELLNHVSRGRKAGTITTQGGSACFEQQAEAPTGCWHEQRNLDGSNRDSLNRAVSPVVRQIVAVPTRCYSVTLVMLGAPRSVVS